MNFKNLIKINKAKQIKNELIKNAILFDPLVDQKFYCYRINKLHINNNQLEILYKNIGEDIYSLMALIRGEQIGIINKKLIYKILEEPTDVRWLIDCVKIKLHRLLGLDKIKIMCNDDINLYELAVVKRINGFSYDEVCDFINHHIYMNRE